MRDADGVAVGMALKSPELTHVLDLFDGDCDVYALVCLTCAECTLLPHNAFSQLRLRAQSPTHLLASELLCTTDSDPLRMLSAVGGQPFAAAALAEQIDAMLGLGKHRNRNLPATTRLRTPAGGLGPLFVRDGRHMRSW